MTRISYLNGEFLPHEKCFVHIEDRGFQLADGVYEVTLFKNGNLIDGDAHIERLFSSLKKINIPANDFSKEQLKKIQLELFKLNNMSEGTCYLQFTRGVHPRVLNCPKDLTPTLIATVSELKKLSDEDFNRGFSVITHDDIRWLRCDIKTVGLLASSLINQKAKDAGFDDVIFLRDGVVTEASFANVFIIDENDILVTKAANNLILCGITRNRIIDIALQKGIKVAERNFGRDELVKAKEVFLSSSSMIIRPVVKIDDVEISQGRAGAVTKMLRNAYLDFAGR
jgi:D-alanine transaminase